MRKFELTDEFVINNLGKKLFRIRALEAFGNVKAGEVGGFLEKKENLSQDGTACVSGTAKIIDRQISICPISPFPSNKYIPWIS